MHISEMAPPRRLLSLSISRNQEIHLKKQDLKSTHALLKKIIEEYRSVGVR
jgi:hypothetical protein